ncbi:hypothetical protein CER18_09335 [Bartonella tribocorum]|uniref:Major tropism determinant second domain-containing protein n=1 Tax=Bartonella tribocorum TaxID=85701 RepID=A0A2N9Y826_9HYPH|nr:hypothetical protein CER18_09335 [Bartonella tribocorum]
MTVPSSLAAGKDYYVYLAFDTRQSYKLVVSENSTYPDGYTLDTSKKIGGFHTLCADVGSIKDHPLSGYQAGDILPHSVWCLNHCPHSSPEGMVYDSSQDLWVDIYLQSGTGIFTRSAYGIPITTGRPYTDHLSDMRRVKKSFLNDVEFASAMYGSNEKTNIQGKKAPTPKSSGGHVDTANRRMISHIGCEDGCGYVSQFLSETFQVQIPSVAAGRTTFRAEMNVLVGGGIWSGGVSNGSLFRSGQYSRSFKGEMLGSRGCSRLRRFV